MGKLSIEEVVGNPEWLPHAYNGNGQELTFVHLPRAARSQLTFLFDRQFGGKFAKFHLPVTSVSAAVQALNFVNSPPMHFLFHTSFCGSTLLAKALDIPGVASSVREPAVFTNLANRLPGLSGDAYADRVELILRLLERPLSPGETVIVKQSSFANRLADRVLLTRSRARTVLLYSNVETYLIALIKRGLMGRVWGRKLFTNLTEWSSLKLDLDAKEILELTDMQVAALAWLMQIHHFNGLAKAFGPQVMLLESGEMFAAPADTLQRVMTFFDLGVTAAEAAGIVAGPVFAKHSKFTDRDYSIEERKRETESVGNANAEELSMVVKWIGAFADHHGVAPRPSY